MKLKLRDIKQTGEGHNTLVIFFFLVAWINKQSFMAQPPLAARKYSNKEPKNKYLLSNIYVLGNFQKHFKLLIISHFVNVDIAIQCNSVNLPKFLGWLGTSHYSLLVSDSRVHAHCIDLKYPLPNK